MINHKNISRVAALALLLCAQVAQAQSQRPNVLLVLSDDHSAAHVGAYGNPDIKTPNLDKFASQGMRFERAYVAAPQCVPSRAALMTGRSPVALQMTRFSAPLPIEHKTWLELLRAAGWFAGVAGRTYHMDGSALPPESQVVFDKHQLKTFERRLDFVRAGGGGNPIHIGAVAQFREFLEQAKGKPFALQLCFSDPHRPLDANAIPAPHDPAKIKLPAHYPDTPGVRADFGRYYDEIARFDGSFAEVLEELNKRGLAENTIVVFMGDNGAAQFRGKGTLYEYGVNVPLIVRWPGKVKAGAVSRELISGEDLAPTFLEACGRQPLKEMTGRSFLKLLRGESYTGRQYVFSERGAHGSGLPTGTSPFDLGRVVIGKRYKLIYNALWQLPYQPVDFAGDVFWKELQQMNKDGKLSPLLSRLYFSPARPMFELFDLEADPNEFNNLIGGEEHATIERELKAALQEWMILERDYLPLPVPPNPRR
ncbi:MAG: sulfatase [Acidobacteria bacterium]|nr:sulfatase [Acidobacteriota bacterium]